MKIQDVLVSGFSAPDHRWGPPKRCGRRERGVGHMADGVWVKRAKQQRALHSTTTTKSMNHSDSGTGSTVHSLPRRMTGGVVWCDYFPCLK